ncbi:MULTISPECIES: hypothetical protein [unclassified Neorhizobium]|uniref:hypothetical protein n=1 Tax=unclassified Neorhizobium TaxID=2629175 RepID=UPI001FF2A591|nr:MULTISPECIES: hypothetical protein [unclassified Neorhizobium]MCJ9670333.1 hypothetical protein [Neorhizobium sp. SHOUNA12B]MCJ9746588.1 hypothetical protein [Neorhizobium sp. SHOUNA12A]
MLSLKIFGRFLLIDALGIDRSPKSLKARGILALLALSQHHCRNRAWLQDKLWSDRDTKKGSCSLRQTLVEIRRSLGPYAAVLKADRENVALDPQRFAVVYNRPAQQHDWNDENEVFHDLNIPDPEFEDWIRNQRMALADDPAVKTPPKPISHRPADPAIFFHCSSDAHPRSEVITRSLEALTTMALLDFDNFQIFSQSPAWPTVQGRDLCSGLSVTVVTATLAKQTQVYVTVTHPATGKRYWSRSFMLATGENAFEEDRVLLVCGEIVQAVLSTFREREDELGLKNSAALLASHGRNLLFRFDKASLREGDRYLQLAYELEPRPQYLAWRAFLRNMANFQHRSCRFLDDRVDLETLAQEALRQASGSASALAIGAHIEYLCAGSPRTSLRLAERAVGIDPLNAVTYAILSNTELALDKREDSRRSALMALSLAGSGEQRAFIEFFGCMSAAALGDYQTAIDHAEASLIFRPSFVAPLRYLVALYTQMRMSNELARAVQRLKRVEPEFHPSWFLREDYPVTTMRRIRLIEAVAR